MLSYQYMEPSVLHVTLNIPRGLFKEVFSAKDLPHESVIPTEEHMSLFQSHHQLLHCLMLARFCFINCPTFVSLSCQPA